MKKKLKKPTIWDIEYIIKLLEALIYSYTWGKDKEMWDKFKMKLKAMKDYLNDGARWHDFGHVFFGFTLTTLFGAITTVWWIGGIITAIYALIKEFAIDGYHGKDTWFDLTHYAISIIMAYGCIMLLIFLQ